MESYRMLKRAMCRSQGGSDSYLILSETAVPLCWLLRVTLAAGACGMSKLRTLSPPANLQVLHVYAKVSWRH